MKIVHVITSLQKAAGTSTFCGEICNQLARLGHEVAIAVCDPNAIDIYPLDSRVQLISVATLLGTDCQSPIINDFSLVHIHGIWAWHLHKVSSAAYTRSIPVVWSTHGMTAPWALKHKWWKKCLPWFLYQRCDLSKAQLIHCTSDFEVEWNQRLGFKGAFIAPLGTFLPEETKVKMEGGGEERNRKVLLFVGRIYPVKALDCLIEAFAMVLRAHAPTSNSRSSWTLRLVGPDQAGHLAELMSLCDRLGLTYSTPAGRVGRHSSLQPIFSTEDSALVEVEFVGPKFGSELAKEYANCDALALVSHTENFGATVVDAMAYGKPVITSTKTSWKTLVEQKCGWWGDNDVESLVSILAELFSLTAVQLQEMGMRGRRLVEDHYTWSAVCEKMVRGYEEVLNGRA